MHKFYGSNPIRWVSQMEHYLSLHDIWDDETKLHVEFMYLDNELWKWWKWHKKCYLGLPSWTMFTKLVFAHFDREPEFFGWFTKL